MGFFKRFGERLTESPEQFHAQQIRGWCGTIFGVDQIAECRPRTRRRVAGVVESIKVIPRSDTSTLEIEIYDGTDTIVGVWFGRRKIPGVDLG
ncbi:MAG: DNA-binding protein, partial [Actinomycetota bacterium]